MCIYKTQKNINKMPIPADNLKKYNKNTKPNKE